MGEVLVRPKRPYAMLTGYYNNPEATAEAFRNLWFHTGDNARMDEEGYVFFVDRKKDAIRRRGENISSSEVEAVLNKHPAILECAIVAAASEMGEDEVKAVVVLLRPAYLRRQKSCGRSAKRRCRASGCPASSSSAPKCRRRRARRSRNTCCAAATGRAPCMSGPQRAATQGVSMAIRSIKIYSDYKSPYAYLAKDLAYDLERETGVALDWLPYTLDIPAYLGSAKVDNAGGVLEESRNAHQWRRVKYSYMDCRREANLRGLTIRGTQKIWDSRKSNIGLLYAKAQGADVLRGYHDRVSSASGAGNSTSRTSRCLPPCFRKPAPTPRALQRMPRAKGWTTSCVCRRRPRRPACSACEPAAARRRSLLGPRALRARSSTHRSRTLRSSTHEDRRRRSRQGDQRRVASGRGDRGTSRGTASRDACRGYAIQAGLEGFSKSPRAGWKIAATSKAGQQHIGVDQPLAGRLFVERLLEPGATTSITRNRMRVAEPEFAFRFAKDIAPRAAAYATAGGDGRRG